MKIVWQVLDDIRDDLQWALRNAEDIPGLTLPMRITSMALDPWAHVRLADGMEGYAGLSGIAPQ